MGFQNEAVFGRSWIVMKHRSLYIVGVNEYSSDVTNKSLCQYYQQLDCLFKRNFFRLTTKICPALHYRPHKGPATRNVFPYRDVISSLKYFTGIILPFTSLHSWYLHMVMLIATTNQNIPGALLLIWISNHMPSKLWNDLTYPLPNSNGCTVEVWERISNLFCISSWMELLIHAWIKVDPCP